MHDFQHSRLADPTSVVDSTTTTISNRGPGARKKNRDSHRRHRSPTPPPPPPAPTAPSPSSSEDIQCNEISSSDDDSSPAKPDSKGQKRQTRGKETPHLSRELSALQLESPAVLRSGSRRDRGSPRKSAAAARRQPHSRGDSAKTPAKVMPRKVPGGSVTKARPKSAVITPRKELRSAKSSSLLKAEVRVVAERVRALDRRVAKRAEHLSAEVEALKANMGKATKPKSKEDASRCLRPRKDAATETVDTPSRKRKGTESAAALPSKSPKVSSPSPRLVVLAFHVSLRGILRD